MTIPDTSNRTDGVILYDFRVISLKTSGQPRGFLIFLFILFSSFISPGKSYGRHKSDAYRSKDLGSITLSITTTNPTCENTIGFGDYLIGNGVINVVASGGVAPYTYIITNFTYYQNNGYFPGLHQGTYDISVTDAVGTTVYKMVALTNLSPQPLCTVSVTKIPSSCTSTDGSFQINGNGGTPPYTYSIDGGVNFTNSNTFSNLTQGIYFVLLRDANGCMAEAGTSNVTTLPAYFFCSTCSMTANGFESSDIACGNDGYVFVWGSGGLPPYQYSLDDVNFVVVNYSGLYLYDPYECKYSGLAPGLYHVYVKDANGITSVSAFTIAKSCSIQISFVGIDASCHQNDGALTVTAINGTPPYSYTMDGINYQASNVFTNLASGGYSVSVKDANGQISSATATVYNKCPTVTATETDEICGQKNAAITATGNKGTTPYLFSIDGVNFQTSNVFAGLTAGNYTITIKDAKGFTGTSTILINNNCIQLTLAVVNTTCGQNNGAITATGSNGAVPYQYAIDGVNFQTSDMFSNIAAGNYTITVKDASGLTTNSAVTITDAAGPEITVATTPASCSNTGGSLTVAAIGGTVPLQFSIDNGNSFQDANVFNGLDSGQYQITTQDANGCIAKEIVQLTALPTPFVSLGADTTLCSGQMMLLNTPQSAGYQYLWQDNSSTNSYTVSGQGVYFLKVTNQFNCSSSDTINITYKPLPVFSLGNDTAICDGHQFLLQAPALPQDNYLWSSGSATTTLTVNSPGLYWLKVSNGGCAKTDSITISFKPEPVLKLGNDTSLCAGQTLLLDATNINSTYVWQNGTINPTLTVDSSGVYSVKVDENGCNSSAEINVSYITKPIIDLGRDTTLCVTENLLLDASFPASSYQWQDGSSMPQFNVIQSGTYSVNVANTCGNTMGSIVVAYENCACKFYVPSAFTPNNDGKNDVFRPKYECLFSNYELKLFNRWGQLIFVSRNPSLGWDGTYGSQPQPVGTYVWEMVYKDNLTGKSLMKTGTVVLIR